MSQLTTHVLDSSKGKPAEDIAVYLFQQHGTKWTEMTIASTNQDGRIPDLLQPDVVLEPGIYKLRFLTGEYFQKQGLPTLYPFVEIVFEIPDQDHYHIPLLLSPFGYSTYRGA